MNAIARVIGSLLRLSLIPGGQDLIKLLQAVVAQLVQQEKAACNQDISSLLSCVNVGDQ